MSAAQDRLTGWKEIAAFLNKGVRTVQRWEREYGLPVHRVGRDADVILAYKSEIEQWVRRERRADSVDITRDSLETSSPSSTAPPGANGALPAAPLIARPVTSPPPGGAIRRRPSAPLLAAAMLVFLAVVLGVVAWARRPSGAVETGPVAWPASGNVLEARDADGRRLWSHAFGVQTLNLDPFAPGRERVVVRDLEGDGTRELIFALRDDTRREAGGLYVFNADGSLRYHFAPRASVVFGGRTYTGPWTPFRVFVLPGTDPSHDVWAVLVHGYLYPTMLVRLSVDGRVIDQYWSSGYIESVARSRWRGQEVLLVAGTNNETRGGALAIFGGDGVGGSTPGANAAYRCESCASGGPSEMLFFPRRCVAAAKDYTATVSDVWRDERDRLHVLVTEGANEAHLAAWYVIGPDFQVESAEYTPAAAYEHQRLERRGMLDHPFGDVDVGSLLPVQRWSERGFRILASSSDAARDRARQAVTVTVASGRRPPA